MPEARRIARPAPGAHGFIFKHRAPLGPSLCLLLWCACNPPVPETSVDLQHQVLDFRSPALPDPTSELTASEAGAQVDGPQGTSDGISPAGLGESVEGSGDDPPLRPIADAGPDQQVVSGNVVALDASGSRETTFSQFTWTQTGGPTVTLSDSNGVRTTFVAPAVEAGSLTLAFRLTVQRRPVTLGYFGTDTVTVVVNSAQDENEIAPSTSPLRAVGLAPRSFDPAGFLEAFDDVSQAADFGMIQMQLAWDTLREPSGGSTGLDSYAWLVGPVGPSGLDLFEQHGLRKAVWVGMLESADRTRLNLSDYRGEAAFSNPEVASAYVEECVRIADFFEPDYLAVGVELETYIETSPPAERTALLAAVQRAYDAVKSRHPRTVVFVYFQYEHVKARGLWNLIRPFVEVGDAAAFSTYPSAPRAGPDTGWSAAELPDDYYNDIPIHLGADRPIVFTELGHPSRTSSYFAAGSEAEQGAFIDRFLGVVAPLPVALVTWTYLYDTDLSSVYDSESTDYFSSMGLLRGDATQPSNPAWDAWLSVR